MKYNPVVHFEMPYKDAKRVNTFYTSAFGWNMIDAGPDMGGYIVAHTAETDTNQMVKTPGTINGGFYDISKSSNPYPSIVISVDNLDIVMANVEKAGGTILSKPQPIPGIGMWAVIQDSEGNRVSILQPGK